MTETYYINKKDSPGGATNLDPKESIKKRLDF